MTWADLNRQLLGCGDLAVLQRMLRRAMAEGHRGRARRVYGRMSAVRRAREMAELDARCPAREHKEAA